MFSHAYFAQNSKANINTFYCFNRFKLNERSNDLQSNDCGTLMKGNVVN